MDNEYDSKADTLEHIREVSLLLHDVCIRLLRRAEKHDASKLGPNEKPYFDAESKRLKDLTFNTPEYNESLKRLKIALDHHYRYNSHHPEHFENGVNGMNLIDLTEMFCDWKAASLRTKGQKFHMIEAFERFKIEPQLQDILLNTAKFLSYISDEDYEEKKKRLTVNKK